MTELELYRPKAMVAVTERDVIDGWINVVGDVAKLADYIGETDFVPKGLRNRPAAIAACILTGRELGIGPMQSLKSIHMVQGVPSLSAEYKRARALAAGHEIVVDESTATRCIIRGRRAGADRWVTVTWTMDMARRAKIDGKEVWRAYPQRMLQARASSELCDLLFPDASLGLGTTEILEDGGGIVTDGGQVVDAATGEVTSGTQPQAIEQPKPRTAQRATRTRTAPPATPASTHAAATQAAGEPQGDAGGALPPLPGEEEDSAPAVPDETAPSGPAAGADPTTSGASSSAAPDRSRMATGGQSPSSPDGSEAATNRQLTAIWTSLTKDFGFTDDEKDMARAACGSISGRGTDLKSTKDLTKQDAGTVIDTLANLKALSEGNGEHPRSLLIALLAEREEGGGDGE